MNLLFTKEGDNFDYCFESEALFPIDLINLLDELEDVRAIRQQLKPIEITFSFEEGIFFMKDNEEYYQVRAREMEIYSEVQDYYISGKRDPFVKRKHLLDN